jgi:hypothetical protein
MRIRQLPQSILFFNLAPNYYKVTIFSTQTALLQLLVDLRVGLLMLKQIRERM